MSLLVLLAAAAVLLSACGKRQEPQLINLPPTPVPTTNANWAVVTSLRLRLREGPSVSSPALITLWKGYVVEVTRQSREVDTIGNLTDRWYYINYKGLRGWVFGHYITMFDSRQRAEQVAKELQ